MKEKRFSVNQIFKTGGLELRKKCPACYSSKGLINRGEVICLNCRRIFQPEIMGRRIKFYSVTR